MNITIYRRITQIAFILLIFLMPFMNILRFDSATRELIIFGQVWGLGLKEGFYADRSITGASEVALQFFLRAVLPWLMVLAVFPLLGFLTGRFFCGWLCPEGTLFELSDYLTTRLLGRRSLYAKKQNDPDVKAGGRTLFLVIAVLSVAVIPVCGGIALTGYFVAPKTIWHQLSTGEFSFGVRAGIIGVSIYMLITSVFVRHALQVYLRSRSDADALWLGEPGFTEDKDGHCKGGRMHKLQGLRQGMFYECDPEEKPA